MERPEVWDAMQAGGVRMAKRVGCDRLQERAERN